MVLKKGKKYSSPCSFRNVSLRPLSIRSNYGFIFFISSNTNQFSCPKSIKERNIGQHGLSATLSAIQSSKKQNHNFEFHRKESSS